MVEGTKLYRDTGNAIVGGVSAGLAERFGADRTLVRVLTVAVILVTMLLGLVAYLAMWALVPPKPTSETGGRLEVEGVRPQP